MDSEPRELSAIESRESFQALVHAFIGNSYAAFPSIFTLLPTYFLFKVVCLLFLIAND